MDPDELDRLLDDDEPTDVDTATWISCPYCGEGVELLVDPGGGFDQEYVEDCEVCCRPWSVRVRFARDGTVSAEASTLDEV